MIDYTIFRADLLAKLLSFSCFSSGVAHITYAHSLWLELSILPQRKLEGKLEN